MGILLWSLVGGTPRCLKPSLLPVWQLLLLLSLRPSPRLPLIPTFCMVDMEVMDTMASVRLRLSPRLLPIPTFCMADMEDMAVILDMLDLDMPDTDTLMVLDMPTTDKLYLSPTSKWTAKHTNILVSLVSDHISVLDIILGDG